MKKQTKKLQLNKLSISNLTQGEMNGKVGGKTNANQCTGTTTLSIKCSKHCTSGIKNQ